MKSLGSLSVLLLITVDLLASSETVITLLGPKEPVFVGEPFTLELMSQGCDAVEKISPIFAEPKMNHIWLKKAYKTIHLQEDNCSVSKRRYLVSAQQSGLLKIAPVEVKTAYDEGLRDAWGNLKEERYWESHYSNELELHVKRLPLDTTLVGEFTFTLDVESRDVAVDTAINAEILIEGVGNFEDLSIVVPTIRGINIFTEEPILEYIDNADRERWRQKIIFTGEADFIIPSMSLEYFDLTDERVKKVQTEAVPIHIIGGKSGPLASMSDTETVQSSKGVLTWWIVAAGIIGIVFLIGVSRRVFAWRPHMKKTSYRDHKSILHLLLLHKDDEGIEVIIEQLEGSVYEGKEMTIDQKELSRLLKKYQ